MIIQIQLFGGGGGTSWGSKQYKDVTHPQYRVNSKNRRYFDTKTGYYFEHHPKIADSLGWRGKDHYHLENPDANGDNNKYLDKNGIPCSKGSKNSHLTRDEFENLMRGIRNGIKRTE